MSGGEGTLEVFWVLTQDPQIPLDSLDCIFLCSTCIPDTSLFCMILSTYGHYGHIVVAYWIWLSLLRLSCSNWHWCSVFKVFFSYCVVVPVRGLTYSTEIINGMLIRVALYHYLYYQIICWWILLHCQPCHNSYYPYSDRRVNLPKTGDHSSNSKWSQI